MSLSQLLHKLKSLWRTFELGSNDVSYLRAHGAVCPDTHEYGGVNIELEVAVEYAEGYFEEYSCHRHQRQRGVQGRYSTVRV